MAPTPGQIGLAVTIVAAVAVVWYVAGRMRWRARLEARLYYGVPWGTLVTVVVLIGFYLLAQGGVVDPGEPVTLPFVTWSYFYPTGLLAAGFAHGSPAHLVSNVAATVAFGTLAEYAWGHYPPAGSDRGDPGSGRGGADGAEPGQPGGDGSESDRAGGGGAGGERTRVERATAGRSDRDSADLRNRPRVRAMVVVPAAMLGVGLLTAVFAAGPGLGFSGAVYAIAGFTLVLAPFRAVVAVVVASTLATLYDAVSRPVVTATVEAGPPMPPEWAGIGFQAHLLGFLIGAVLGIAVARARGRRPTVDRVFAAAVLFGSVQGLWLLVTVDEDVFVRHQAVGLALLFVLAATLAGAAGGSDRPLLGEFVDRGRDSTLSIRRALGTGWLALLAFGVLLGIATAIATDLPLASLAVGLAAVVVLLAAPALPAVVRGPTTPLSRREVIAFVLVVATVLVAFPSVPLNMVVVDDPELDGVDDALEVDGYTVAYGENVSSGRAPAVEPDGRVEPVSGSATEQSGLLVVDADRELWTVAVGEDLLAHEGNETVALGGIGWRAEVTVERQGWDVVGNDTAYAVDVAHGDETARTFTSDPVRAAVRLDGHEVAIEPTAEAFALRVRADGATVGEASIPEPNGTATVGDLEFVTEVDDDDHRVVARTDDGETAATVATRERYAGDS